MKEPGNGRGSFCTHNNNTTFHATQHNTDRHAAARSFSNVSPIHSQFSYYVLCNLISCFVFDCDCQCFPSYERLHCVNITSTAQKCRKYIDILFMLLRVLRMGRRACHRNSRIEHLWAPDDCTKASSAWHTVNIKYLHIQQTESKFRQPASQPDEQMKMPNWRCTGAVDNDNDDNFIYHYYIICVFICMIWPQAKMGD